MNALDTNVWIYSHDSRDPQKQAKALELIDRVEPMALLWQVGCEFLAAARKLEPFGFARQDAWDALDDMQAMADAVLLPDPDVWKLARDLESQFTLSFWDALIVAGCIRGGVKTLHSEDISGAKEYHGVEVVSPFVE
jgi:predicted nucleic acid-binding protein